MSNRLSAFLTVVVVLLAFAVGSIAQEVAVQAPAAPTATAIVNVPTPADVTASVALPLDPTATVVEEAAWLSIESGASLILGGLLTLIILWIKKKWMKKVA
jgi:Flp pilus assembly protein protease CpaA